MVAYQQSFLVVLSNDDDINDGDDISQNMVDKMITPTKSPVMIPSESPFVTKVERSEAPVSQKIVSKVPSAPKIPRLMDEYKIFPETKAPVSLRVSKDPTKAPSSHEHISKSPSSHHHRSKAPSHQHLSKAPTSPELSTKSPTTEKYMSKAPFIPKLP